MKASQTKPRPPRVRSGKSARKGDPRERNQATEADFEREGMGVAPKE
jgi:hypothetical protein